MSNIKNYKKNVSNKKSYTSRKNAKSYDRPIKNVVREKIIELIRLKKIKSILTLETHEYLFSKQLPDKKIFVFEFDRKEHRKMEKHKPENVKLFFGDVSSCSDIDNNFECIYLDFCYGFDNSIGVINQLKNKIIQSKIFAVTFCLRNYYPEEGDYQFEIQRKLVDVIGCPLKPLYGYTYRDNHNKSAVMITMLFEVYKGVVE